jgi:hypothetical protein
MPAAKIFSLAFQREREQGKALSCLPMCPDAGNSAGLTAVQIDRQLLRPPCDLHEILWLGISHDRMKVLASFYPHSENDNISAAGNRWILASFF